MERNLNTEAAIIINDLDSIEKRIEALQAHPDYTRAGLAVSEAKSAMKSGNAKLHQQEMAAKNVPVVQKNTMIEIDCKLINPARIVSAEIETRHYANGSTSHLVVKMDDGSQIVREHGFGFNAFTTFDKIKRLTGTTTQIGQNHEQ